MAATYIVESEWPFRAGPVSRMHLLRVSAKAVLFGFGGVSFLALAAITGSSSVLARGAVASSVEAALLSIGLLNTTVVLAIVCEEALHAAAVVQCAGRDALRGITTRRRSILGVPIPLAVGVVYAPWLGHRDRAGVAAAGALGSVLIVGGLAAIVLASTGSTAAFWLVLVPGVNLLPLRRLGATGIASDGDTLVEVFSQLRPGVVEGLGLLLRPTMRALFAPIVSVTPTRDFAQDPETSAGESENPKRWSENHG